MWSRKSLSNLDEGYGSKPSKASAENEGV